MFETILKIMGASDAAIAAMGPTLTVILASIVSGAVTQAVKFMFRCYLREPWFTLVVRSFACIGSFILMLFLSDMNWHLALVFSPFTVILYHVGLAVIRKYWPWLEVSPMIGSVQTPIAALNAKSDRVLVAELERQRDQ